LPEYISNLQQRFGNGTLGNLLSVDSFKDIIASQGSGSVISRTFGVFSGLFTFITVLVISFYSAY
jgi:preprotein translocase subunit SecG